METTRGGGPFNKTNARKSIHPVNMKASPALLEIKLPSHIVVPVGCDLNALFEFLAKARAVEEIISSNDPTLTGTYMYSGESTYFAAANALPKVSAHGGKIFDSKADAQLAKNEIVTAELAARLARATAEAKEAA